MGLGWRQRSFLVDVAGVHGRADDPLMPRDAGGGRVGLLLALVAHGLLIAALAFGLQWRLPKAPPNAASAEIWAAVPRPVGAQPLPPAEAAPPPRPAPATARPAPPAPAPVPPAPAPAPVPAPAPAPAPKLADAEQARAPQKPLPPKAAASTPDKAQLEALAASKAAAEKQAKAAKAKAEREAKAAEAKAEREAKAAEEAQARRRAELEAQAQAQREAKARQDAEKAQARAEAKAKADAKTKQEAERKALAKAEAASAAAAREQAQLEADRAEQLKRVMGQARQAGGGAPVRGAAAAGADSGPSAGYGARVKGRIKPNIVLAQEVSGNPVTEVEVRAAADGAIISRRITKPSGNAVWDQTVLRAIDRTGVLPRDTDGRVPSPMILVFPREEE